MREHFIVLGIHDGHNASACLLKDAQIVAAVAEERLTRIKNEAGYPKRAVEEVLKIAGCAAGDIDMVALGSRFMHHREFFFSWDWYRKGYADQLKDINNDSGQRKYFLEERANERRSAITQHLGIFSEKIVIVEHHEAHAAAAYFGSPWVTHGEKILVLTLDGSGDGICATVNIGEKGRLSRIAETKSAASLGKIYSRITLLLGMKPWEHEYKLMGLAPYADEEGVEKSYKAIRSLVNLGDRALVFQNGTELWTNYCYSYLKNQLENHRFDWVAGAIQRMTEELVSKWCRNAIAETRISRVACGGGVFMNVKANMLLSELKELDGLFIFPSSGDESICLGAAYKVYADHLYKKGSRLNIEPFDDIYLGPEFSRDEIESCIKKRGAFGKYDAKFIRNINDAVLKLLLSGKIVGRFEGRMEWGARALGNRSILMDPRNIQGIRNLNAIIKKRDFWMPFAPTILRECQDEYINNPKGIKAPYMTVAFRTKDKARTHIAGAMHPYDFTVRAQLLDSKSNPEYYDLVQRFRAATGVGALLNTSFNLHGEPIVCSPDDAIDTFEKSGLEFLALGDFLVSKGDFKAR